jgi:septal ring factor EnvC (AmiA/AmiB activator)
MANIARDQKAAKDVQRAIERVIQREIELARKKAAEEEARKRAAEEARQRAAAAAPRPGTPAATAKPNTGAAGMKAESERPANTGVASSNAPRNIPAATRPVRNNEDLSYKMSLTPEATALANGFEGNRGRLPWPVEKGFISAHFGTHPHPLAPKVMVENQGVSITTPANAAARAVYDGTVTSIFSVPGAGQCIMVSHGTYFTVYTGLGSVLVAKGQSVHTKQVIGTVGENDEGANVIDFQVWKVGANNKYFKMDPEGWIAR